MTIKKWLDENRTVWPPSVFHVPGIDGISSREIYFKGWFYSEVKTAKIFKLAKFPAFIFSSREPEKQQLRKCCARSSNPRRPWSLGKALDEDSDNEELDFDDNNNNVPDLDDMN